MAVASRWIVHPQTKKSALEVIFTVLHAGGKFEAGNYKTAGGLHGVGASVVNALSRELMATVRRDGAQWEMSFRQGKPTGPLKKVGAARGSGTTVFFRPDPTIFPKVEFDAQTIRERLEVASYLHRGVKVTFEDEPTGRKDVYQHAEGLVDYLKKIVGERQAKPVHDAPFVLEKENGLKLELVLQWTESTDEHMRSYVNGIPTGSGGTHENGLRAGVGKAVRNYIDTHNLDAEGRDPHRGRYPRRRHRHPLGLPAGAAVPGADQGPVEQPRSALGRGRHGAARARALDEQQPVDRRSHRGAHHPRRARARGEPRGAAGGGAERADVGPRQPAGQALGLHPPGLHHQRAVHRRRRFGRRIGQAGPRSGAAGDSAAARQGAQHRGRLDREGAREQGAADLVTALGCGVGKNFDLARMRYGKVILLADADSDGHHISTLLLTFLYRHLPQLIQAGKVYLAQPPLYRIDIGKDTFWALDEAQKAQIIRQRAGRATPEITRFKGLGEMMPKVLWETTLNPRTRRLLKVEVADQLVTDRVINELMGKDASARFRFIMDRAEDAEEIDV